ncbi:MAG: nitroreductase family protein [Hyphomicrobiales bacterium]
MTHEDDREPLEQSGRTTLTDAEMVQATADFYEAMKTRRTIRDFAKRSVPRTIIENAIKAAGTAPSGANQQPWHFVAVSNADLKAKIRHAAEEEERKFYEGAAGDEWLEALKPIGTDANKPHLEDAPWLIVVFAQKWSMDDKGERAKNYYVTESVGLACGLLLTALHKAGLATLTHTPNPMKFLTKILGREANEKPLMIIAVGHASDNATIPTAAKIKKPLDEILTVID